MVDKVHSKNIHGCKQNHKIHKSFPHSLDVLCVNTFLFGYLSHVYSICYVILSSPIMCGVVIHLL